MNPRVLLLLLCLAGNILLAMVWLNPGAIPVRSAGSQAETISRDQPQSVTVAEPATSTPITTVEEIAALQFHWSQVAAPDFALYIKQLRAFGVPEPRVREIIMGAIEAMYRPRRAALRPPVKKADDVKFWAHRNVWGSNLGTKEQRTQLRVLQKEETELIKSLFGPDVYEQMSKEEGNGVGIDWTEKQYGFLPKELREQVMEIEQRMNEDTQEIYALNEGNMDQYDQADLKKLKNKYRDELAKILTPDQLLQWDLRHSDTANQLKNDLSAFDPTEDEFRELFKYQQGMEELHPSRDPDADPVPLTAEERKANSEKQKELDAQLAAAVGTNRVAEYKLEQDYAYRNLIEQGVAKESVFKLADVRKQAEAAARKIRNDKTLTPGQRNDALAAIRSETQSGINDLLGDKLTKTYTGQGGYWLNNIAPLPKPAATTP